MVDRGIVRMIYSGCFGLREEEAIDELLSGLTDKQKDYVYSYCNWNPLNVKTLFGYRRFEEIRFRENLPF